MQVDFTSALAPLSSAYYRDNCEPPLTTKTASFAGTLDYIWVHRHVSLHITRETYCSSAAGTDTCAALNINSKDDFHERRTHVIASQLGWGWAVTQLLELPYEAATGADAAQLTDYPAIPNDRLPSDHLALGARLTVPCSLFSL